MKEQQKECKGCKGSGKIKDLIDLLLKTVTGYCMTCGGQGKIRKPKKAH